MKRRYTLELLISFLLITVKAFSYDFKVDGLCYNKLSDNTVELTWEALNTPYSGDIVVPSYVSYNGKGYTVLTIGRFAMANVFSLNSKGEIINSGTNSKLKSVSLPSTIISIEERAFSLCSSLTSISIPNSVTSIGNGAFDSCSGLTSIIIPNSVTSIGNYAFYYCSGLTSIKVESGNTVYDSRNNCNAIIKKSNNELIAGCKNTVIPNSVTSIGDYAFWDCRGLTSISIPNSVTSIGDYAFWDCRGLTSISIPNSVTSIGNNAFRNCSGLTSISIPNSVTSIGNSAFSYCGGLTSIKVESGNNVYDSRNNCNAIIKKSTNELIAGCKNTVIPNSVTSIGNSAFSDCSGLTSISIPNSVTSIGNGAFYYCSGLTSISIPNSVTSIGNSAFYYCSGLTSISIPNSVTSIGNSAFYYCRGLKDVISEIKTPFEISENVFSVYSNAKLTVPSGTKSAYQSTAGWNKFTNIVEASGGNTSTKRTIHVATAGTLPNLISESEKYTIEELTLTGELNGTDFRLLRDMAGSDYLGNLTGGNLQKLDLSGIRIVEGGDKYLDTEEISTAGILGNFSYNIQTNKISQYLFCGCPVLQSLILPNSITSIELCAIEHCKNLTLIVIPQSVTSIGGWAFYGCNNLKSITIPASVTSIGMRAFLECRKLEEIIIEEGNSNYVSVGGVLFNKNMTTLIQFPQGKTITTYDIPGSVKTINELVFYYCKTLTRIGIPEGVTSIGHGSFCGCEGLTSITLPNSLVQLGSDAFCDCCGLTSISIPNSVTSIGSSAFNDCSGLTSIIIPNSVRSIGSQAFYSCSGLTSISIPNSVTSIGNSAFSYCSGLTSIIIPNSVRSIGSQAFYSCSGLTSISIPNSVTSIGNSAFSYCSGLKDVISEIKTPFEISENVFSVYSTAKLTVPSGTKSAYQSTAGWNKFTNIVESTNSGDNTGTKRTIHVATAGTLPNLILESEKYTIEELTLTGELNGTDFRLLRDMAGCNYLGEKTSGKLAVLDMTNAKIVAGGEKYLDTDKIYGKGGVNSSGSFHYGINNSDAIPDYVFCGCYLKEMHIPNSVTSIGNQAFSLWSGPTSITIPNSVKSIGDYAFFSCLGLTSITIPNSVMSIGSGAFRYCSGLKDVISEIKTPFEISENVFSVYSTAKLTVPKGTKSAYLSTSSWNKFSTIIEAEGGNVETEVTFASNGITYKGTIATQLGEVIAVGSNSKNLEIPSTVSYDGRSYSVTSIKNGALDGLTLNYLSIPSSVTSLDNTIFSNCDLGALIWKANNALSSNVFSNAKFSTASNFLLYVNSASYAPSNVKNVVVGTSANTILLSDNGGNFYCPKEFTAQYISYSHNYSMKTGGNGKGWETLALPFDVQKIEHKTKGTLTPFAKYNSADDSQRPFWLYEFGSNGFKRTDAIKANTPYIIAMPNDSKYDEEYIITGDVTFSATNAQVYETESLVKPSSNGKTFAPAFAAVNSSSSVYALNVSNDLTYYSGPYDAGSRFVSNLRNIYPFEAYMTTSSSGARALAIEFEDDATGIEDIPIMYRSEGRVKVYNLTGLLMFSVPQSDFAEKWKYLPSGVYIVNGQKMIKSDDVQYNLVY